MSVVFIPGIAKTMTELEFWRKAWDALAANDAFALESRGWVEPPRFAVEFLPPISCRIEHNGVNVHLSALLVAQDDPRGKAWHDLSGVREAQFRERGLRLARLHASNHEIQIVVGPGFLLEKCVDAPAAVDPVADAVILESATISRTSTLRMSFPRPEKPRRKCCLTDRASAATDSADRQR